MNEIYDKIKRKFVSTRQTIEIGCIMNEFSLGFFEVTKYLKQLESDGVIREVEGGYAKVPPEERPCIKNVDAILSKLDADTAEYCKTLTEDADLSECNDFLDFTRNQLYFFESRMERAGLLARRADESEPPRLTLDEDEYAYFQRKIGKFAEDKRKQEVEDEYVSDCPPRGGHGRKTRPLSQMDRMIALRKKIIKHSVYARISSELKGKMRVNVGESQWSYEATCCCGERMYVMLIRQNNVVSGGTVSVKDKRICDWVKKSRFPEEKGKIEKLLAYYGVEWLTTESGEESLGCAFNANDGCNELDAVCKVASCLDALCAIQKGVL